MATIPLPTQAEIEIVLDAVLADILYHEGEGVRPEWTGGIFRTEDGQLWISIRDVSSPTFSWHGWTDGQVTAETMEEVLVAIAE